MPLLKSLTTAIFLVSVLVAAAQEAQITALSVTDGLSQEYVTSIFQDKRGFIWVGTYYGLNRYDGHQFKSYLPDHTNPWALKSNMINNITEDTQGLLWISTEDGAAIMDPVTERFVHLHSLLPEYDAGFVREIIISSEGSIWLYQEQENKTEILVLQIDSNLKKFMQTGAPSSPLVKCKTLALPPGSKGPLNLFFRYKPTQIIFADASGMASVINTTTQEINPVALSTLGILSPQTEVIIENQERSHGFIVSNNHDFNNVISLDQLNPIFYLPDGKAVLLRFYDTTAIQINLDKPILPLELMKKQKPILSIDQPMSYAKLVDRQGNLWVGTAGYGIRKITFRPGGYRHILKNKTIYNLAVLPNNQLWPGCFENNLILNTVSGYTTPAPWLLVPAPKNSLSGIKNVIAVLRSTLQNNIYLVESIENPKKLLVHQYNPENKVVEQLPITISNFSNSPPVLLEDHNHNLWIAGAQAEIVRWNPTSKTFSRWDIGDLYPPDLSVKVLARHIAQDHKKQLWVATNYGIIKISNTDAEPIFQVWHNYTDKGIIFGNNGIFCLYPDPQNDHLLWMGTLGSGFALFDTKSEKVKYFKDEASPNLVLCGIVPDQNGNLWLSSGRGVSCFNTIAHDYLTVNLPETIANSNFNPTAFCALPNGEIALGTSTGLFILQPSQLLVSEQSARVWITNLKLNGNTITTSNTSNALTFDSNDTPILQLTHDENAITISLAAPEAQNLSTLQYRYRIDKISPNWINLENQNTISLAGLPPGRYLVELQLVTLGHSENKAPISNLILIISPPWYLTWYAYLMYCLLGFLSIWGLIKYDRNRIALQHESELSKQEMNRLASLDQLKSRFFTYIAHEFKTPLTIIIGISNLVKQGAKPLNAAEFVEPVLRESNQMLQLIDEILDVSRLENGVIELNYSEKEVITFLQQIVFSYKPLLDHKNITLTIHSALDKIFMDVDQNRLRYIFNNLLSNALHYTPKGGNIKLVIQELNSTGQLPISISDTGTGIAPEHLPYIFDKYFRAENEHNNTQHFGLGLSFVRELLLLMKGNISVESTLNQGTTFHILLPVSSNSRSNNTPIANTPSSLPSLSSETSVSSNSISDAPLLLIVEDNASVVTYLKSCLQSHFNLLFGLNGQEGFEIATKEVPDLILTDIMMPVMDGLEMTRLLKQNNLTSHIPVVMLSAKSEVSDRLQGQKLGADNYLAKPFHNEELIFVLKNLHQLQQNWKQRYAQLSSGIFQPDPLSHMPIEVAEESLHATDQFIENIYAVFEEHYHHENFDLVQLCKYLHISKTQLYRKLDSITDQTAMELLKNFRLQKAMELLQHNPDLSTKEVAYKVGFKERSHFSYIFTKKFNTHPSKVRKKE